MNSGRLILLKRVVGNIHLDYASTARRPGNPVEEMVVVSWVKAGCMRRPACDRFETCIVDDSSKPGAEAGLKA